VLLKNVSLQSFSHTLAHTLLKHILNMRKENDLTPILDQILPIHYHPKVAFSSALRLRDDNFES